MSDTKCRAKEIDMPKLKRPLATAIIIIVVVVGGGGTNGGCNEFTFSRDQNPISGEFNSTISPFGLCERRRLIFLTDVQVNGTVRVQPVGTFGAFVTKSTSARVIPFRNGQ